MRSRSSAMLASWSCSEHARMVGSISSSLSDRSRSPRTSTAPVSPARSSPAARCSHATCSANCGPRCSDSTRVSARESMSVSRTTGGLRRGGAVAIPTDGNALLLLPVAERLEVQRAVDGLELGERARGGEVALALGGRDLVAVACGEDHGAADHLAAAVADHGVVGHAVAGVDARGEREEARLLERLAQSSQAVLGDRLAPLLVLRPRLLRVVADEEPAVVGHAVQLAGLGHVELQE